MTVRDTIKNALGYASGTLPAIKDALEERDRALEIVESLHQELSLVKESTAELELAIEDLGWQETGGRLTLNNWNLKRDTLRKMMNLARHLYIFNPIFRRTVEVQSLYVWALGVTIRAKDKDVQLVLDKFFDSSKNKVALTSQPAWADAEREQQITGNNFFAVFRSPSTGAARIRSIPVDYVHHIYCDPDDNKDPWFYLCHLPTTDGKYRKVAYPDCEYTPEDLPAVVEYNHESYLVEQDTPVWHLRTGGLNGMSFGAPEYYSIIAWCIAYKKMLENWATIMQAYAQLAMKMSGLKDSKKVAAAKTKLGTGLSGTGKGTDGNPPTNVAGWFAATGGVDISAIRTSGSTTSPDVAKPLKDMAAAGGGLPSHFYGDSDSGNFATSTTLDRPTELKFVSRQKMWMEFILSLIRKLLVWSAEAPNGILNKAGATVEEDVDLFSEYEIDKIVKLSGDKDSFVAVSFPTIIERNVTERVRAVVAAATLNGSKAEGIIPDRRELFRMLMEALAEEDVDEKVEAMYPQGAELQGYVDPREDLEVDQAEVAAKKALAKAAQDSADASKIAAKKPAPKPSSSGAGGRGVSNKR